MRYQCRRFRPTARARSTTTNHFACLSPPVACSRDLPQTSWDKMVDLSSAQQSVLIELYRTHSVLWDNTLPGYKDKNCRTKALVEMQEAFLQQTGIRLEMNDLKTKLQSFRTVFGREMTKVANSVRSGDEEYTPSYSHWQELQFLSKFIKKRDTLRSNEEEQNPQPQDPTPELIAVKEESDSSLVWVTQINPIPIQALDTQPPPDSPSQPSSSPQPPVQKLRPILPKPSEVETVVTSQQLVSSSSSARTDHPEIVCQLTRELLPSNSMLQEQHREEPSPSHSDMSPSLTCNFRKRKDPPSDTVNRYRQNKNIRPQADNTAEEDSYTVWAKNLVQDLKKVKNENRRTILKIQINRLVQDQILKEIETEENSYGS
ncbi:uncharacterized protein LOC143297314 isoform X2 [Babylonia areolata]|uniref:uncharacterized protein LOC143297314 isoform X2 n=1 Tax=Babylonia areolata TaxID=304850 RepID=UPI003FD0ED43